MSASQYKRYIWLVDTIRSAGKISREELDRRWADSDNNERHENGLPDSTFFRYKNEIERLFDIDILYDRLHGKYYIDDSDINSRTKQWLLSQFAVSQSLDASRDLRERMLYEPIPKGTEYLTTIVHAMQTNRWLRASHRRFDSAEPHDFLIAPYCLKVFKQRWYVLGAKRERDEALRVTADTEPRIYALDRMLRMEETAEAFRLPRSFDARNYFAHFYGVFCGPQYKPQRIQVRVVEKAAPFMRSLPLHASQREVAPCVFEWHVAPTLDFVQQLRTYGAELEVLSPLSLREAFRREAERVLELYRSGSEE